MYENLLQGYRSFKEIINEVGRSNFEIIPMSNEELANEERNYNNAFATAKKNFKKNTKELKAISSIAREKGAEKIEIINELINMSLGFFRPFLLRDTVHTLTSRLLTTDSVIPPTFVMKYKQ